MQSLPLLNDGSESRTENNQARCPIDWKVNRANFDQTIKVSLQSQKPYKSMLQNKCIIPEWKMLLQYFSRQSTILIYLKTCRYIYVCVKNIHRSILIKQDPYFGLSEFNYIRLSFINEFEFKHISLTFTYIWTKQESYLGLSEFNFTCRLRFIYVSDLSYIRLRPINVCEFTYTSLTYLNVSQIIIVSKFTYISHRFTIPATNYIFSIKRFITVFELTYNWKRFITESWFTCNSKRLI